jgi:hypothetical protein
MDQSARWWSLLSDYVRSIKKCAAVATQLAEDGIPVDMATASDENLSGIIKQRPLQPMSLSHKAASLEKSPALPPSGIRNSQTASTYGSSSPHQFGAGEPKATKSSPNLPPRRPPSGPPPRSVAPSSQSFAPPSQEQFASFPTQSQFAFSPPPQAQAPELPAEVLNPHANLELPVTLQMEMALQAAVEERKTSTVAKASNPWGEDESNIWG